MLDTLQQGQKRLSNEAKTRIVSFTNSQLAENGGFMDKNRKADLYYTPFGLMLAYILKPDINTHPTEQWLYKQKKQLSDLVYLSAFIRSRLLCRLLKTGKTGYAINRLLKTGKTGYVINRLLKTRQTLPVFAGYPHDDMYSPYSQFLFLSLQEDLGIDATANQQELLTSLSAYRIENRGYSNIRGGLLASTNATVAALAIKGQLCGYPVNDNSCRDNETIHYLYSSQDESGGFFAGVSSPVPDLLSTATALFMMRCYGITPRFVADDFIEAHWLPSGGFGATLMDETGDVEYTFYGLLALGAAIQGNGNRIFVETTKTDNIK